MKKQFFSILMLLSVATSVVATPNVAKELNCLGNLIKEGASEAMIQAQKQACEKAGHVFEAPVQGWSEWVQNGISSFGKNTVNSIKQTCENNPKTAIAVVGGVAAVGLGYVAYNRYFKKPVVNSPVLPQLQSDIDILNDMLLVDELAADKTLVFKTDADDNVDSKGKLYLYEIKAPSGQSLDFVPLSSASTALKDITLESFNGDTMTLTTHRCGNDGQIVKATIMSDEFEVSFCIERKEVIAAGEDMQQDIKDALKAIFGIKETSSVLNDAINEYILLNGAARQAFDKKDEDAQNSALTKREVAALNLLTQMEKAVTAATAADAKAAAEKAKQEAKNAAAANKTAIVLYDPVKAAKALADAASKAKPGYLVSFWNTVRGRNKVVPATEMKVADIFNPNTQNR